VGIAVDLTVLGLRVGDEEGREVTLGLDESKAVGAALGGIERTALGVIVDLVVGLEEGLRDLEGAKVGPPVDVYVGLEGRKVEKVLVGEQVFTKGALEGALVGKREFG